MGAQRIKGLSIKRAVGHFFEEALCLRSSDSHRPELRLWRQPRTRKTCSRAGWLDRLHERGCPLRLRSCVTATERKYNCGHCGIDGDREPAPGDSGGSAREVPGAVSGGNKSTG